MNFKELLESKEMTGYRFAKNSGIHQPAVSKFVTGKRDPLRMSLRSAKRAADTLDMTLDEFFETLDEDNEDTK